MSDCKTYRREIDEAGDGGQVSGGTRAHAALCRACGDELRVRESLRALVGGLGKVEAPADFEFRLRARMAAAKVDGGRSRFGGRWLYGFAPVAVAACFVVVSATLYFRQATRTNPPAAPAVVASAPAGKVEPIRVTSDDAQGHSAESATAKRETIQGSRTDVALSALHHPVRDLRSERRAYSVQRTAVSSVTAARVLRPVTITLRASAEPLRMILRDERGAARVVPMRAVSFGSQDFLAREATLRPSAATEVGGVW